MCFRVSTMAPVEVIPRSEGANPNQAISTGSKAQRELLGAADVAVGDATGTDSAAPLLDGHGLVVEFDQVVFIHSHVLLR